MATRKAAASSKPLSKSATGSRKSSAKTAHNSKQHKFTPGTYIVPRGNVSIAVPAFWTLRQTNEDLEVEAPSGNASVIVTAYKRNDNVAALDAREYLKHFVETAPKDTKYTGTENTKTRAGARFRDQDGDNWEALFLSNGDTLLLATCNTHGSRTSKEAKVAAEVLRSLNLKRR